MCGRMRYDHGVYNMDSEPWKVKVCLVSCGEEKNLKGMLMGLIPIIITRRLWITQLKARMEDKRELPEVV